MSAHHLRITVVQTKFDRVERVAAEAVAGYCGWTLTAAKKHVEENAVVTAEPLDHPKWHGLRWRAVVEVTV